MKAFALFFILGLTLPFRVHADQAENSNPVLQARILQQLANQSQKKFHFLQEKKLAILSKPLVTEGELLLKENDTLIWDIQQPYAIRYELHPGLIKEMDANGERTMPTGSNPLAAALTQVMVAAFSGHWENRNDLAKVSAYGTETAWELEIIPYSIDLQKLIQGITVNGSNSNIHQINILEINHDSTVIHLTAIP
jgi:hypothetical protein